MAGLVAFVARCGAERQCVSHTWPGCAGRADSIRAALSRSTITAACSAGPHDGDPRVASSRARLSPYLPRVRWARGMAAEDAARVYECSACHRQGIGDGRDGVAPHARRALELSKWFLAAYLMARDRAAACCVPSAGRRVAASIWRSAMVVGDRAFTFGGLGLRDRQRCFDHPGVRALPRGCARLSRPEPVRDDPVREVQKFGQDQPFNRQAER
jgi:hypothetical protein